MGKKLSTFIGDSTYTRAPPNYRSPLRSNYKNCELKLNFKIQKSVTVTHVNCHIVLLVSHMSHVLHLSHTLRANVYRLASLIGKERFTD